ncbi:MAG: hypothetical protein IPP91_15850 [Betaproteobacteria bacterium]|nr:hypothetical protein [Betaproteobacteria bacterium]
MNAANALKAAWWVGKPARAVRLKRPEAGYALYEAERRAGLPGRVANAHARFDMEARAALRDWLMV